jgi:aspartate-semialdehyde dehydrogenase
MKIGILGATGAVGRQMLECIEERNINAEEIRLFASEKSKGKTMMYKGQELVIDVADAENLKGLDYVLGAVSNAMFAGFVADENYPLAFIVVVENGGYGSSTCVPILSKVLAECKAVIDGK